MGWATCLPAVCMSRTSIKISHKTLHLFEEKPISENGVYSTAALEFCSYRHEKSSEKTLSFMCDYCDFHSESKLNIFEHFIKNHVFLCTMCSFAGVGRSSIYRHCLECHESFMKDKFVDTKLYKLKVDDLHTELNVSSKGMNDHLHRMSDASSLFSKSDYSSEDEISRSSFLSRTHGKSKRKSNLLISSDNNSDIDNEMESYTKRKMRQFSSPNGKRFKSDFSSSHHMTGSDDHEAETSEKIVHFLDETSSQGRLSHKEADYNQFSDSSQMDLFFSTEGAENEPDLSESIFHDHQEMFMVTRLPFPIRQDDSPNDMSTAGPEPPSILQTILQGDKQEPNDGTSALNANLSVEKTALASVDDLIPHSASPGLSVLADEALHKTFEAVIPSTSSFTCSGLPCSKSNESDENKISLASKGIPDMGDMPICCMEDVVSEVSAESKIKKENVMENFLLSAVTDQNEVDTKQTNQEKVETMKEQENETIQNKKGKFALLRNLLKQKPKGNDEKVEENTTDVSAIMPSSLGSLHESTSLQNPSNMTLLELLSIDTPFPLRSSRTSISLGLKCDACQKHFTDKITLDSHVKDCNINEQHPSAYSLSKSLQRKDDSTIGEQHSLLTHEVQSSLRTDGLPASKMLSKISEDHIKLTFNNKVLPPSFSSYTMLKGNNSRRAMDNMRSKVGLRHQKLKVQGSHAFKFRSKLGNHSRGPTKTVSAVTDGSVLKRRIKKQKSEQDDNYDPESENSQSSDDLAIESHKQRKKMKRIRKHKFSSLRSSRLKVPSAMNLMSKLCEKASNGEKSTSSQNIQLSLSLSSSLSSSLTSSILSSSLSSSVPSPLSQASALETDNAKDCQQTSLSLHKEFANDTNPEEMDKSRLNDNGGISQSLKHSHQWSSISVHREIKQELVSEDESEPVNGSSVSQIVSDIKVPQHQNLQNREPSQTLLHKLLSLPAEAIKQTTVSKLSIESSHASKFGATAIGMSTNRQPATSKVSMKSSSLDKEMTKGEKSLVNDNDCHKESVDGEELNYEGTSDSNSIKLSKNTRSNEYLKLSRNRSFSLNESTYDSHNYCEEIKNLRHSSRLSASMMDIPDPPATHSSVIEDIKPPTLPSQIPPLHHNIKICTVRSLHSQNRNVSTQSTLESTSRSGRRLSISTTQDSPQANISSSPQNSLLKNLLTQQSMTDADSK